MSKNHSEETRNLGGHLEKISKDINLKDQPLDFWKEHLGKLQFQVTRQGGTEPAFTGYLWDNKEDGTYFCSCCKSELFSSDSKFDSGSGWPSFFDVLSKGKLILLEDNSLGMKRIEVKCSECNSHLGHLFNDGPNPTGLRYCINSISLVFEKK